MNRRFVAMFRIPKRTALPIPLSFSLLDHAGLLLTGQLQQQCRPSAHQAKDHVTTTHATSTMSLSLQDTASLQTTLLYEASYLTRALYRKCLRSIKLLAGASDRDEENFAARESNRFDDDRVTSMMTPPVDRQNELQSRFEYYKAFARENFDGHFNLLGMHGFYIGNDGNMTQGLGGTSMQGGYQYQGENRRSVGPNSAKREKHSGLTSNNDTVEHYVWREEQIDQFVYLIRSGEEKRQWILNDYGFDDAKQSSEGSNDDTKSQGWSQELESRLQAFETQSKLLVRAMYTHEGWLHSSDYEKNHVDDEAGFFESDFEQTADEP